MTKEKTTAASNITREQLIELLNEDLAGEYQAIIAYTVYSQVLKGAAYTDIARELELHAAEELQHAIKIAKQIDYLGGMPGVTCPSRSKLPTTRSSCCARIWRTSANGRALSRAHPAGRGAGRICVERNFARDHRAGAGS
jgi:hypothetical protein